MLNFISKLLKTAINSYLSPSWGRRMQGIGRASVSASRVQDLSTFRRIALKAPCLSITRCKGLRITSIAAIGHERISPGTIKGAPDRHRSAKERYWVLGLHPHSPIDYRPFARMQFSCIASGPSHNPCAIRWKFSESCSKGILKFLNNEEVIIYFNNACDAHLKARSREIANLSRT